MATFEGFIIRVDAIDERDIDRQMDNLLKLRGVTDVDFKAGWFGSPDVFTVTFDTSAKINTAIEQCDKAVARARKVKSNNNSTVLHDDFLRHHRRQAEKERYNPTVKIRFVS